MKCELDEILTLSKELHTNEYETVDKVLSFHQGFNYYCVIRRNFILKYGKSVYDIFIERDINIQF